VQLLLWRLWLLLLLSSQQLASQQLGLRQARPPQARRRAWPRGAMALRMSVRPPCELESQSL